MITKERSTGWAGNVSYEAEPGDKISCKGITVTIDKILYQDYFGREEVFDIEFLDTSGKYRHWKQWEDGGDLIPKKPKYTNWYGVDCTDLFQKYGYC